MYQLPSGPSGSFYASMPNSFGAPQPQQVPAYPGAFQVPLAPSFPQQSAPTAWYSAAPHPQHNTTAIGQTPYVPTVDYSLSTNPPLPYTDEADDACDDEYGNATPYEDDDESEWEWDAPCEGPPIPDDADFMDEGDYVSPPFEPEFAATTSPPNAPPSATTTQYTLDPYRQSASPSSPTSTPIVSPASALPAVPATDFRLDVCIGSSVANQQMVPGNRPSPVVNTVAGSSGSQEQSSDQADVPVRLQHPMGSHTVGLMGKQPTLPAHAGKTVVVTSCRCKSPFCTRCAPGWVNQRVRAMLSAFSGKADVIFLSLTVDPQHFHGNPVAALRHLTVSRAVSRLFETITRQLRRRKELEESQPLLWYAGLHFQEGTGMPHYHAIVEHPYIDKSLIESAWLLRPSVHDKASTNERVCLGHVDIRANRDGPDGLRHMAHYLVKQALIGFPDDILALGGERGQVRPLLRARSTIQPTRPPKIKRSHSRRGPRRKPYVKSNKSYADKVRDCGQSVDLYLSKPVIDHLGQMSSKCTWNGRINFRALGCDDEGAINTALAGNYTSVAELIQVVSSSLGVPIKDVWRCMSLSRRLRVETAIALGLEQTAN